MSDSQTTRQWAEEQLREMEEKEQHLPTTYRERSERTREWLTELLDDLEDGDGPSRLQD